MENQFKFKSFHNSFDNETGKEINTLCVLVTVPFFEKTFSGKMQLSERNIEECFALDNARHSQTISILKNARNPESFIFDQDLKIVNLPAQFN